MQPLFISYSSRHRDLTERLAEVLEEQYGEGSVWWDRDLESRGPYADQIRAALEKARVVLVIWTTDAAVSDYVYAEAHTAHTQGKLVNIRPAGISYGEIPEPYNIHHFDQADDHDGILESVAKVMAGTPLPTRVRLDELYYRQHGRRVLDPKREDLPRDLTRMTPTQLLQARHEVVGYLDATGMRDQVLQWCRDETRTTTGQLIHGPGGLGKTRLMIDVAARLRDAGWRAGFLATPHDRLPATLAQRWQAIEQLAAGEGHAGVLLVVDYAEGRQEEVRRLAALLRERADGGMTIRLMLLARTAGEWWSTLNENNVAVQIVFAPIAGGPAAVAIPELDTADTRLEMLEASVLALRPALKTLGYDPPDNAPSAGHRDRISTGAAYQRPLAIQLDAFLWLASTATQDETPTLASLINRMLGLERRHWHRLTGEDDEAALRDIARGLAQLTLMQGVPDRAALEALLSSDGFYGDTRAARVAVDRVATHLERLYAGPDGDLHPLEPDLIGEHHVAAVADTELVNGALDWIDTQPEESRASYRNDLVAVLQRATREEHGERATARAEERLDHLIASHIPTLAPTIVAVILDTPGSLLRRLQTQIDTLGDAGLGSLYEAFPESSLMLMETSLRVAERLVAISRNEAQNESSTRSWLAGRLNNLGIRLSALGRSEEALAASEEAVATYRELAITRPDAFLPDLAMSLNNLGNLLSHFGHLEDALAASEEAVAIRRELATTRPDAFLPNLAGSLNNFSRDLSALGRSEEALAVSEKAVATYRKLATTRRNAFLPDLAMSLNNLGIRLSALGHLEDALAASEEAVAIRRKLATKTSDAFLPDLAMSLNNLGISLSALGHREDALAASEEAVAIRRELATALPDAFSAGLASSLNSLGIRLSKVGRREDALAASEEAVATSRELAAARPDAFLPDLAVGLNNLGNRLSALGRREDALAASEEAVAIRRELATTRPDAFLPDLAGSLNNLVIRLSALGRREDALAASGDAVATYRKLAPTRPDVFLPELARSVRVRSNRLSEVGRHEESAHAAVEALTLLVPFAEELPQAHAQLLRVIAQDVIKYCGAAGLEPDTGLLERVARVVARLG